MANFHIKNRQKIRNLAAVKSNLKITILLKFWLLLCASRAGFLAKSPKTRLKTAKNQGKAGKFTNKKGAKNDTSQRAAYARKRAAMP
ncbi:MAG: hypothetical protein Q4C71_00795 [Microbacteriaceae bacterium]|nr:hypothetical protein [Microbacteriaceae bacterium]